LGDGLQTIGSFSEPVEHLISYMAPQRLRASGFGDRDYPWRRRAYDRTLSCPDLARAINDFLSPGVDFFSNDDSPIHLCA
jgi:hypothetical protein